MLCLYRSLMGKLGLGKLVRTLVFSADACGALAFTRPLPQATRNSAWVIPPSLSVSTALKSLTVPWASAGEILAVTTLAIRAHTTSHWASLSFVPTLGE